MPFLPQPIVPVMAFPPEYLQMLQAQTEAMKALARKSSSKAEKIVQFDGENMDAKTWLEGFERACEHNGWYDESQQFYQCKCNLKSNSRAEKWFDNWRADHPNATWTQFRQPIRVPNMMTMAPWSTSRLFPSTTMPQNMD